MRTITIFLSFILLLVTNTKNCFSQGCSSLNFKEESNIASTCGKMVMTMRHDIGGKPILYVANKEAGLKIYDIKSMTDPRLILSIPTDSFGFMDLMNLSQYGNYLFLALGNHFNESQNAGMAIVDVTDPEKAFVTDFWEMPSSPGGAGIVISDGKYAYLGAMKHGLSILDVSNKHSIKLLSNFVPDINFPTPNPSNEKLYNARGMVLKNNIVYLCYDAGGIRIINTFNKLKPVETGRYSDPALNGYPRAYNNLVLENSKLYVAVDYCGVEILNVSDTSNITRIGAWNPYNCPKSNWFASPVHANEIHLNKDCNTLFISTGKSDLIVLNVSDPSSPDSCNYFGGTKNEIGSWGMDLFQNKIFISYICAFIPFPSNWTGIKLITYTPCINKLNTINTQLINFYPNPSFESISFNTELNLQISSIKLINSNGQSIDFKLFKNGKTYTIDVSDFPSGLYYLRGITDKMQVLGKFHKNRGL